MQELRGKDIEVWSADPGVEIKAIDLSEHYDGQRGPSGRINLIAPTPDELYEAEHLVPLPYGYRYSGAFNADRQYIFGFTAVDPKAAEAVQQILHFDDNPW